MFGNQFTLLLMLIFIYSHTLAPVSLDVPQPTANYLRMSTVPNVDLALDHQNE